MKNEVTMLIDVRGADITVDTFIGMLNSTVELLKEIDATITTKEERLDSPWVITTVSRSNPYGITIGKNLLVDDYPMDRSAVGVMCKGLEHLERFASSPQFFTEKAISLTEKILRPLANGVSSLSYKVDGTGDVTPTLRALANLNMANLIRTDEYHEIGTIEGTLLTITAKGGHKVIVRDRITQKDVTCNVTKEQLEQAEQDKMVERNVYVTGLITYNMKGTVTGVREVELIRQNDLVDPDVENQNVVNFDVDKSLKSIRRFRNAW